jgi:hypothetical protein
MMKPINYKGILLYPVFDPDIRSFAGEIRIGGQVSYISGESVTVLKDGLKDAVDFYESKFGTLPR